MLLIFRTHDYERRRVRYPGCATNSAKEFDLAKHCMEEHSVEGSFAVMDQEFYNAEIFDLVFHTMPGLCSSVLFYFNGVSTLLQKWKKDVEAKTSTWLVKRNSSKFKRGSTTTYVYHLAQGNVEFEDPLKEKDRYRREKRVHRYCQCFLKMRSE